MAPRTRLEIARDKISSYFDSLPRRVFGYTDLSRSLAEKRGDWNLGQNVGTTQFINFLLQLHLTVLTLESDRYASVQRFVWRTTSLYSVAVALKPRAYISHGSAVFLHGLTDLLPKTIYVNHEQSAKPSKGSLLSQEGIHRAFAGKQRETNLIYKVDDSRIAVLNGKFTNRLEVAPIATGEGSEQVDATKLERTLIDVAVRPSYAGGVFEVVQVYKAAKERASISVLIATLKKLGYVYPYHQAIGFYMERAGYPEKKVSRLRALGIDVDFYLTYALPETRRFDSRWRIFYPEGL